MSVNRREIRRSMGSRSSRRSSLKAFLRGRLKAGPERKRMERPRVILARKIREAMQAPAPAETVPTSDEVARKWAASMAAQLAK